MSHAIGFETKRPVSTTAVSSAEASTSAILAEILGVTDPKLQSQPWEAPQISQKLGPQRTLWKNLAEEKNTHLFTQDLYHLGRSYELLGQPELAKRIYFWLGRNEAKATDIARQARERSALLSGEGRWPQQLELFFRHGVDEVTAPDLLLGMGAAGLGYGLGVSFGRSAASLLGLKGVVAHGFGSALAIGAEVTAFTLGQRAAAWTLGSGPWPQSAEWGHHWVSAAMMIGILRSCHRAGQGVSFLRPKIPSPVVVQGTQYAGLWANAYLRRWMGWDPQASWAEISAEALGQWATFHVAGRLGRELFAPLQAQIKQPRKTKAIRSDEGSVWAPTVWAAPNGIDLGGFHFAMKTKSAWWSEGSHRGRSAPIQISKLPAKVSGPALIQSETLIQWVRSLMDHKIAFQQRLLVQDLHINLASNFGWNPRILGEILNELPNLGEIPHGRKIRFHVPGQDKPLEWVKAQAGFENSGQTLSVLKAAEPVIFEATGRESLATPSLIREVDVPLNTRENALSLNQVWQVKHLPMIINKLDQLGVHLKRMPTMAQTGQRPQLILVDRELTLENLRQATPQSREGMTEGQSWSLLVPKNDVLNRVFIGQIKNERVTWRLGESSDWERVSRQALFERPVVRSPLEVFQLIDAITKDPSRLPDTNLVIKHRGILSYSYLQGLDTMVTTQLRRPSPGNRISILNESEQKVLEYHRDNGYWARRYRAGPEFFASQPITKLDPDPQTQSPAQKYLGLRPTDPLERVRHGPQKPEASFEVARIPTDLMQQMRTWMQGSQSKLPLEILVHFNRSLTHRDEARIQQRLAESNTQGILFLHDTHGLRSVKFSPTGSGTSIEKIPWSKPRSLEPLWVGSPLELLRNLAYLQKQTLPLTDTLRVKVRGVWKPGEVSDPLLHGINFYRSLPFGRIEILWPLSSQRKTLVRSSLRDWQEGS